VVVDRQSSTFSDEAPAADRSSLLAAAWPLVVAVVVAVVQDHRYDN